jgi:hypothetical protein
MSRATLGDNRQRRGQHKKNKLSVDGNRFTIKQQVMEGYKSHVIYVLQWLQVTRHIYIAILYTAQPVIDISQCMNAVVQQPPAHLCPGEASHRRHAIASPAGRVRSSPQTEPCRFEVKDTAPE